LLFEVGEHGAEGEEQGGEAAAGLLALQGFEFAEARFEDFGAGGESFAGASLPRLKLDEGVQVGSQSAAAGVLKPPAQRTAHVLSQVPQHAAIDSMLIEELCSGIHETLPLRPFAQLGAQRFQPAKFFLQAGGRHVLENAD
jgi:hypothetical protein